MRISIRIVVAIIVVLLFLASIIALYFALGNQYTVPLLLVALINTEAVVFLVFLITRGIISPLNSIRSTVRKVGEGDFSVRVKLSATKEIMEFVQAVNEMIIRLQNARVHEAEIERLKTEFVSLAAHQLRTPLSAVKWTMRAFLDGDFGDLLPQQKEFINKTYETNEKMIVLINDLLNVTRIEEGRYVYKPVLIRLQDVVRSLVDSYKEEAQRRGIILSMKSQEQNLPMVLGDEEKIRLAMQNLIDNAFSYTPDKGSVTIALEHGKEYIGVSIQDTGIGVPLSEQSRLFEKFFRAENAKRMNTHGTGLGLYLAKNIIEAHGGSIQFASEEGKGATFTIRIPLPQK